MPISADSRPVRLLRRGFSLVEILIVIVILAILAGIVFPHYQNLSREARAKSQSANVRKVREMIEIHRSSGQYPLTAAGFPAEIHIAWFRGNLLPENSWTMTSMVIQTVAGGAEVIFPLVKTFDSNDLAAVNAWYNTDNGRFHSRVPAQNNDEETLALFNIANATDAESLDQTTR